MATALDQELLERLREIDPAAGLDPATPEHVTALVREVLTRADDTAGGDAAAGSASRATRAQEAVEAAAEETSAPETEAPARRPSAPGVVRPEVITTGAGTTQPASRLGRVGPWLAAAAAVAAVVGVAFGFLRGAPADEPPSAADASVTTTTIGAPVEAPARCMMPSPELLATVDLAVDATVAAVDDDQVRLAVQKWYAGTATDELVVTRPPSPLALLIGAPELKVGQRYLLAANDGELLACGFSGPLDPDRSTLYTAAFGE